MKFNISSFPNHEMLSNHGNQITKPRSKRRTQKSDHVIMVLVRKIVVFTTHLQHPASWCMMRLAFSSWSGSILARFKSRRSQSLFHSSSAQLVSLKWFWNFLVGGWTTHWKICTSKIGWFHFPNFRGFQIKKNETTHPPSPTKKNHCIFLTSGRI